MTYLCDDDKCNMLCFDLPRNISGMRILSFSSVSVEMLMCYLVPGNGHGNFSVEIFDVKKQQHQQQLLKMLRGCKNAGKKNSTRK